MERERLHPALGALNAQAAVSGLMFRTSRLSGAQRAEIADALAAEEEEPPPPAIVRPAGREL